MSEFRYLNVRETLVLYAEITRVSRVESGHVQSLPGLESALAQPKQTFDGNDLYLTIAEKAGALLYSLSQNHAFTDGNKRIAFMAANAFLRLNGKDLDVGRMDTIEFMTSVASGEVSSAKVAHWIQAHLCDFESGHETGT